MAFAWPLDCDCCDGPGAPCPEADLAIWMANENQATDDNFLLKINGAIIGPIDLGQDACVGHLYLPTSFAAFTLNDVEIHPDVLGASNCLDTKDGTLFTSANMPAVATGIPYNVFLENTQNNGNGNAGTLFAMQVCADAVDGHPILRRIYDNPGFSGSSGADFQFTFEVDPADCIPCNECPEDGSSILNGIAFGAEEGCNICFSWPQIIGPGHNTEFRFREVNSNTTWTPSWGSVNSHGFCGSGSAPPALFALVRGSKTPGSRMYAQFRTPAPGVQPGILTYQVEFFIPSGPVAVQGDQPAPAGFWANCTNGLRAEWDGGANTWTMTSQ